MATSGCGQRRVTMIQNVLECHEKKLLIAAIVGDCQDIGGVAEPTHAAKESAPTSHVAIVDSPMLHHNGPIFRGTPP